MNIKRLKIKGISIDKMIYHLTNSYHIDYQNLSNDMAVLANENFYFRNKSSQLDMVILKQEGSTLYIDLLGAAGGTGLFNINLGSEKSFIKRTTKIIAAFCASQGIEIEVLS